MIALDLASLPGNRWKADLHDPRLREEADFTCPFVPLCLRIRYCTSYRWSAKSVRLMTSRCLSMWR